jgi:hypothetical protein
MLTDNDDDDDDNDDDTDDNANDDDNDDETGTTPTTHKETIPSSRIEPKAFRPSTKYKCCRQLR